MDANERATEFRRVFHALRAEIGKAIVGQEAVIERMLVCLFAGGHALLEGVPGLGKTQMVKSLSECLDLELARIQFTPDLMPGDIIGTNLIVDTDTGREFRFAKGPLFTQVLIADEINRATPKTQAALLEAMQEHGVTVGGKRHVLEEPFFVLATQNPIEIEGTYALPEAQLDRFAFKLEVGFPDAATLAEIVDTTTGSAGPALARVTHAAEIMALRELVREVPLPSGVKDYVARLVLATQPSSPTAPERVKRFVRYGASPRGGQALVLGAKVAALVAERFNVGYADVRGLGHAALDHRVVLNFEGEAEGVAASDIVADVLDAVPTEA